MVINDDVDDLTSLPRRWWNHFNVKQEDRKKVVVLGTGWGSTALLQKIDPALYDITIVSPRNHFFYTPMLTGVATGTVKASSIMEGVRQSSPMPQATFYLGEATGIDVKGRTVSVVDSAEEVRLPYDHLVIGVGAEPNTFGIAGVAENAYFLKELNDGMRLRRKILDTLEMANVARLAGREEDVRKLLTFAIVGGGPTGVEFAAEFSDFVNQDIRRLYPKFDAPIRICLIEAFPNILNVFDKSVGLKVQEHFKETGVEVLTNTMVTGATKDTVSVKGKDGSVQTINTSTLVWTGGIRARPITQKLGAAISSEQTDRRGLIVDKYLRVKGAPENEIFAIGDCAFSGKPPTAQVASQQGTYLGRLFRDSGAVPTHPFEYVHKGTLAYIGGGEAAAALPMPKMGANFFSALYEAAEHAEAAKGAENINIVGMTGFALWRSVYFSKVMSYRSRYNIGTDWVRAVCFGRNVSSPLQGTFKAAMPVA